MLELINNKMKGWFTWTIIIVISAVFVFTGVSYFFSGSHVSPQAVVKVGDVNVSRQQFQQVLAQGNQSGLSGKALEQQTLQYLIQQQLLVQGAQKSGIIVTPLALQSAIFSDPAFQDNGHYSQERFDQIARYYGGAGAIESILGGNLMATGFVMPLTKTVFALPAETKQASQLLTQSRDITTLSFDNAHFIAQVSVTDQEAQAYYKENQSQFIEPAQANIEYAQLNSSQFAGKYQPSEEAIQHYYQQNQSNLINPQSADGVVVRFKDSSDSEAILSALAEGLPLTQQQLAEVTTENLAHINVQNAQTMQQKALLQLSKNNPFTEIANNQYVVLTGVNPSSPMTFAQAKPTIERILTGRHALQNYNQALAQLDASNYQALLKKYNITDAKTVDISEGGANSSVDSKLVNTVFESNQSFGYIDLNNTSAIIYHVTNRTAQQPQSFDQVKAQIMTKLKEDKAAALEEKSADDMIGKLNQKILTVSQAQKDYPVKIENRNITRDNPTMTADQLAQIYRAKVGEYQLLDGSDGATVFVVDDIKSGQEQLPPQQVEAFYTQLEYQSYLQSLKETIPVEVNTALFNE